jgi:GDP-L-fucose synthase
METNARIFIAGARGLVGSAIHRHLLSLEHTNLLTPGRSEVDLLNTAAVESFFKDQKPDYVFFAAAKVGGIVANSTYPADFLYDNLMIEMNVIRAAHNHGAKKLLFLGSSCIYPKLAPQPMPESALLSGYLEETNKPYAVAKIAGIVLCQSFNRQFGSRFISVMPTNLYGKNDNYHPENSHVIPGMIRKFHEAKSAQAKKVLLWGTGKPLREFLFSDDLANACVFLMNAYNEDELINVGSSQEVSISELAGLIREVVGYDGLIEFDASRPDGTPRKLLDSTRINKLGWHATTALKNGLKIAYNDFLAREKSPNY